MENQNKYDQIDFCLNILYDFYYNKNERKCYQFKPIIKNSITVNTLKKSRNFVYDEIFNEKIDFVGYYNDKWYFKRSSNTTYSCILCIGGYNIDNTNLDDLERGELINMGFHYILSESFANDNLKQILLPVMNFDINYKDLIEYNPIFQDNIKKENTGNNLYVNIYENYYPQQTLEKYLRDNIKNVSNIEWKVIIFQTLFALFKISERLRNFRHNNLNLNSIFVVKNEESQSMETYKIGKTVFNLPNVGIDIKITNFEKSFSVDYYNNKDTDKQNDNPYYDVHYFLQNIYFIMSEMKYENTELEKFINDIIPEKLKINLRNDFTGLNESLFSLIPVQYLFPSNILKKNNFFSEFIINMDITVSPINNDRIKISRLREKDKLVDYSFSSPTEISDAPRMVARKINYKNDPNNENSNNNNMIKKTSSNNINMIKGTRKLYKPSLLKEYSISEGDIFDKAEKAYNNSLSRNQNQKRNNKKDNSIYYDSIYYQARNNGRDVLDNDDDSVEELDEVETDFKGLYDEENQRKEDELNRSTRNNSRAINRDDTFDRDYNRPVRTSSRSKNNDRDYDEPIRTSSRSKKYDRPVRTTSRSRNYDDISDIDYDSPIRPPSRSSSRSTNYENSDSPIRRSVKYNDISNRNNYNRLNSRSKNRFNTDDDDFDFEDMESDETIKYNDGDSVNKFMNLLKEDNNNKRNRSYKRQEESNDDTSEISVTPDNEYMRNQNFNQRGNIPQYGITDSMTNNILNKLPENYQGQIPDHLLGGLPMPNIQNNLQTPYQNSQYMNHNFMPTPQQNTGINSIGASLGVSNIQNMGPQFDIGSVGSAGLRGQQHLPSYENSMMPNMNIANMGLPQMNQGFMPNQGFGQNYNPQLMPQMGGRVEKPKKYKTSKGDFFF